MRRDPNFFRNINKRGAKHINNNTSDWCRVVGHDKLNNSISYKGFVTIDVRSERTYRACS
ncbi:hypothetical protein OIU77_018198 [Salix suchowensis]|uniref:Uncharacterized protein n=1 Tax=Salix suchowensis TaxID=1278906 RepID=A0ABQ8ZRF2_9ROSI|nr:hypothetical protein OIU77_018198 [Salix suchowensis]